MPVNRPNGLTTQIQFQNELVPQIGKLLSHWLRILASQKVNYVLSTSCHVEHTQVSFMAAAHKEGKFEPTAQT